MTRIILVAVVAALAASPAWAQAAADGAPACNSIGDTCPWEWHSISSAPTQQKPQTNLDAAWQACLRHSSGKSGDMDSRYYSYSFDKGFEDDCNLVQFKFKNHDDLKIIERGLADPDGKPAR